MTEKIELMNGEKAIVSKKHTEAPTKKWIENQMDCPECKEKMIVKVGGPRAAYGKCEKCGFTIIA